MQGKLSGDLPFYKVGDISDAWQQKKTYLTQANHYLTKNEAESIKAKPLPDGTTVFAKIGAAIALNRRAILAAPSLVDNNVMGLCPLPNSIDVKMLYYFMCTIELGDVARATTVPSVRHGDVEAIPFPLPPLPEQHRIVAEIEKQFTRLDASVAALKRVQANLKRYRASVLKAACEGKLVPTEAELARAESRDYEPADQLMTRILVERRARWEAQEKRGRKYKEPAAPDTSEFGELPEGWVWAMVDALLSEPLSNGRSVKTASGGFQVLRLTALRQGQIDQSEFKNGAWTAQEAERFLIREGDFFVSRGNGSIKLVGLGGLVGPVQTPVAYPDTLIRFRLHPEVAITFFAHLWNSSMIREQLESMARTTAGIYKVNQQDLSLCLIPLPPLSEQRRIVAELERRLSVIQQAEATVEANLTRAERLRQSILKQAFSGKLVPQDPNDEPAPALLERIRVEREAAHADAKNSRQTRPRRGKSLSARQLVLREGNP